MAAKEPETVESAIPDVWYVVLIFFKSSRHGDVYAEQMVKEDFYQPSALITRNPTVIFQHDNRYRA